MRRANAVTVMAVGAALAWGCSNPADVAQNSLEQQNRPFPPGDGIVTRLPLCCRPLGLRVSAAAGFAYISQIDASQLVRFNTNTQTFGETVAVGSIPSDIVFSSDGSRAYVSNQFSQNVGIIDVATNTQIDVIPTIGDPFALAISPDGTTLLVTTNSNALRKFDIATKTEVGTIPLIATSHHILMDSKGKFLYVATRDGGTVMEVDWRAMTSARTFAFGGRTQDMAFSPNGKDLYISNEVSNLLHVVRLNTGESHSIPLTGGGEGLALGDGGKLLFVGLVFNGGVEVIDRETEATVRVVPVGGVPREIQPAISGAYVIVTNEAGWVDLLEPTDSMLPPPPPPPLRVSVPGGPIGVAASGDIALVAQLQLGSIARLNLTTDALETSIGVGSLPVIIVFHPSGTTAYVSNLGSQSVSIVDVASNTQTGTIPVTGDPFALAINPGGTFLFVTTNVNRVFKIDLATNSAVGFLDLPATSHHILASPNDTLLYVATRDGGSVLEVNWRTMTVARTFILGGVTQGMAISQDRTELYVANESSNLLHFVTLSSGSFTSTPLAGAGEGLTLSADGATLWVGLVFSGQVQSVDRVSRTVVQTISTGGTPRELATDAVRGRILVANEAGWVDIIH